MTPWLQDPDVTLYHGDVLDVLRELPDESLDCAATSPPFYGLRDYGVEGQIGLESTPELWRDRLVEVFREVRRVLVPMGTLVIEIGDSYASGSSARRGGASSGTAYTGPRDSQGCDCACHDQDGEREAAQSPHNQHSDQPLPESVSPDDAIGRDTARSDSRVQSSVGSQPRGVRASSTLACAPSHPLTSPDAGEDSPEAPDSLAPPSQPDVRPCGCSSACIVDTSPRSPSWADRNSGTGSSDSAQGHSTHRVLKPKDLVGAPWLLAFGLRADGWYWRGCNIWAKPNCMPESAKDRCTTAHSYVLHFSKSSRYYFDGDAVSEPAAWERWGDQTVPKHEGTETAAGWIGPKTKHELVALGNRSTNGRKERTDERRGFDNRLERADGMKHPRSVWTIPTSGYPGAHFATWPPKLAERIILAGCPKDGTVLDPFAGSGTTLVVARRLGRRAVGIELNESYCELARARIANWWRDPPQPRQPDEAQASLFATEGAA